MAKDGAGRGPPDTLGVENAIRTSYLLETIRGAYYANARIRQQVTLDWEDREEMALASPESTLKILVNAKYLFLEISNLELQGMEVWEITKVEGKYEEIIVEVERAGCGDLAGVFRKDLETLRSIVDLRNKFSSHPTFAHEVVISRMESVGFGEIWQCARRLLLLKDAIEAAPRGGGPPARPTYGGLEISGFPYRLPTREERGAARRAREGPRHRVEWPKRCAREIMQEGAACIRALLDEIDIASTLHRGSPSTENKARLCDTVYSLKYSVLEMHNFIECYKCLRLVAKPGFLERARLYRKFKNQYGAHNDEERKVASLVQLLNNSRLMRMIVLDMHEALCVSGRLFDDYMPQGQISLPTRDEAARMDAEIEGVRQRLHDRLGDRFSDGGRARRCHGFRRYVQGRCGLG